MRGMNVLFVDYAVPMFDRYAGSRTNFMYLEMLVEMGLNVKFLPADFKQVEPYTSTLNDLGIETLDGDDFSKNWESWFAKHGQGLDFVFFNKPEPTIKFLESVKKHTNAAVIYQCHDLHHLRLRRKAEVECDDNAIREADRFEQIENHIFSNSDVILTFSTVEEGFIRSSFPNKPVFTVPLYFYDSAAKDTANFEERRDLLFVGACAHTPNRDAILWFCNDVLPHVVEQIPDIVLNVVGANPPKEVKALQSCNVKILGGVSDLELNQLYHLSKIAVIPLRFGAGVKGKTIEALHKGVPIVSTSIGLEGIKGIEELQVGKDDPVTFAREIISLYRDKARWTGFALRGTAFVAEHLTSEKTSRQMSEILDTAKSEKQKHATEHEPPRLITFYLPQYHPIPENDEWWGKGFTEWRNVAKAESLFPGHYQPHLPADLGFYDLRSEESRIAQADLAREYGVHGFCFYHYWFNGKRLLERPVEEMLSSGKPDFPFCLCWANENWTRRWDGEDQHVLMQQDYSEEDDREHIRDLFCFFRDARYIRVNGKPMFLVYRTENMPDPARTAEVWREEARSAGIGELYLVRVESIGKCDPAEIGFDAALEFAPDWWNKGPQIKEYKPFGNERPEDIERIAKVHANNYIHSYDALVEKMSSKPAPNYTWMQCVTPAWDNTARRKEGAHVFLNSSPEKYQFWLERTIAATKNRLAGDEKIVFINAWNEWAEGNHLEPDQLYGHAYLEATRNALFSRRNTEACLEMDAANLRSDATEASPEMSNSAFQLKISALKQALLEKDQKIKGVEIQLLEQTRQLQDVYNSRSWRITRSLRWAFQKLGLFKYFYKA